MKAIIGWIITPLLEFLWSKITALIEAYQKRQKKDGEIEEQSKAATEKLKDAKTGEDIDKATDDVLNNL